DPGKRSGASCPPSKVIHNERRLRDFVNVGEREPMNEPSLAACTINISTLHGGRREGVQVAEVNNGRLRLALLPQRGMGIWKAWVDGVEFGWQSPVQGPVHPAFVPLEDASGLGWLEGFDELLCRCGLQSNGAPDFDAHGSVLHPLHGRIAN